MAGGIEFNRGKFKELVLYLSERSAEDPGFGMVKLNKLLFRTDFEAYRLLGHSITGSEYEKQDYGPVARPLPIVLDELAREGRLLGLLSVPTGPYTRKVPKVSDRPDDQPDTTLFSDDERAIIDSSLHELAVYGGKGVSEWSHRESAGWRVKKVGEEIPYSSAIINLKPLSRGALARVRRNSVLREPVRELGTAAGTRTLERSISSGELSVTRLWLIPLRDRFPTTTIRMIPPTTPTCAISGRSKHRD